MAENTLRIFTWNVNGYRACLKKGFLDWLESAHPDLLCLQETRVRPEELSEAERQPAGYAALWNSGERKGYSGTAVFYKVAPRKSRLGIGVREFDEEGRLIELEHAGFTIINAYFPNGGRDLTRVPFKLRFYDRLLKHVQDYHREGRTVIVTGDWNTCHRPVDIARPKENEKNTGFLPEERAWIDRFIEAGLADTFREQHPDLANAYTWWSNRAGSRERNVGWRLDYFMATRRELSRCAENHIHAAVKGSDHCPVELVWKQGS